MISDHLYYRSAIFLFLGFYAMVVYLNSYLDTNYHSHLVTTQIQIPTNGNRFLYCGTFMFLSRRWCTKLCICDYDYVNTQASRTKSCKVHHSHLQYHSVALESFWLLYFLKGGRYSFWNLAWRKKIVLVMVDFHEKLIIQYCCTSMKGRRQY